MILFSQLSTLASLTMDVFNPKILDASIRDISACLSDTDKVDLILYALRNLELQGRSRTIVENAVQSCLQVSTLSPENIAKARVLRAKERLACGSNYAAQLDLQAALEVDPDHPEANHLLHQRCITPEERLLPQPRTGVRFSADIWREIALFLPRRDLKALLFVPHMLSRVASQLLFRKIDLHFGAFADDEDSDGGDDKWAMPQSKEEEAWHAKRTADILTRMIVDPSFAALVRTLRMYLPRRDKDGSISFQTGMLANALPKLTGLRNVHIAAGSEGMVPILRILRTTTPRLKGLSLAHSDNPGDVVNSLEFQHLTQISSCCRGGNPAGLHTLIGQQRTTLRAISFRNENWAFPIEALSLRNLTHLDFYGQIPLNSQTFADILCHGRQLEDLSIQCILKTTPSSQFRAYPTSLPFLRHFSLSLVAVDHRVEDRDLFPAVAEFLRGRTQLKTLSLTVTESESIQRMVGFDAGIWGVLPSLTGLKGLWITYPRDLAPSLALWLVPRTVTSLNLDGLNAVMARDPIVFISHLKVGAPPGLLYIGLAEFPIRAVSTIAEKGFPSVKIVRIGQNYWSVLRRTSDNALVDMEAWPRRRVKYHKAEWMEWMGCGEAQARDPTEFVL